MLYQSGVSLEKNDLKPNESALFASKFAGNIAQDEVGLNCSGCNNCSGSTGSCDGGYTTSCTGGLTSCDGGDNDIDL